MKINEVIVVEGKNDTAALKQYFECDTIETHGTHIGPFVLELIREAQKQRGVIIFTDPDAPGNMIRNTVNEAVPGCKNAFIEKDKAKTSKKVGIEHASREDLEYSLSHLLTYAVEEETFTMEDCYELGLNGQDDSSHKRDLVARKYPIGKVNAKQFVKRVNMLKLTREMIEEVLNNE